MRDFQYSCSLRVISTIVLSFFIWSFGGVFDIAYAIKTEQQSVPGGQKGKLSSQALAFSGQQQAKKESHEERFQKSIDEIENILKDEKSDHETKRQRLRTRKADIDHDDLEIRKQFKETEEQIKGLPEEIQKRHREFVKKYHENLNTLRGNLDDIDRAKTDSEKIESRKKAQAFLEKVKAPKRHRKFDPNKMPHRSAEPVFKEPRMKPEEFEKDGGQQPVFSNQMNPSPQTRTPKPLLIAADGPLDGLLSEKSQYSTQNSELSTQNYLQLALANPPSQSDLAETIDIKFTPAIVAKAAELGHNPTKIYNWVRNNIEYVPTYGSIQGADMCLQTKLCNDTDTASLLIALLRASGIHAHYVYGTIQLPIDKVQNWLGGFTDPMAALNLLASAGVPVKGLSSGGKVQSVQMEHMSVEALIDYIPSRGARHKNGQGDTWIELDASFKQYSYTPGLNVKSAVPFDSQSFLGQLNTAATVNVTEGYATGTDCSVADNTFETYKTSLGSYISQTGQYATIGEVFGNRSIIAQEFPYLLGTLPYETVVTGYKTSEIPDTLRHKIEIRLKDSSLTTYLSVTKGVSEVAGKKITLRYVPATLADEEAIKSYLPKGADPAWTQLPTSLPAYLINIRPELRIGETVVATGPVTTAGRVATLETVFTAPGQSGDVVTRDITTGEFLAIAIDSGRTGESDMETLRAKLESARTGLLQNNLSGMTTEGTIGDLYSAVASAYFAELDKVGHIRGLISGVTAVRLPSEAIFTAGLKVGYAFGVPHTISTGELSLDAPRKVSVIQALDGNKDKRVSFAFTSGLDSSSASHLVMDGLFSGSGSVSAMSAVKALSAAKAQGLPVYFVNQTNIEGIMPKLQLDADTITDIRNAANTGKTIIVSQSQISVGGWTGAGYVIVDPATGNNACMLTGGTNGGVTEGVSWAGNSLAAGLLPEITPALQGLVLQMVSDSFTTAFGELIAGTGDIPQALAASNLDIITTAYLFEAIESGLGCFINLSSHPASGGSGSCMAVSLGALCVAMETSQTQTEIETVTTPNVVGMGQGQAEAALAASGLLNGTVTTAFSETVPAGQVLSQRPSANTVVYKWSAVDVVISSGLQVDTDDPVLSVSFNRTPALYTAGESVMLMITATDNSGHVSVTVTVDGAAIPSVLPVTTIGTTGYLPGSSHVVGITATDLSGNISTQNVAFGLKNPSDVTETQLEISSPLRNAEITAPTAIIGTVSDTNLYQYTLSYSPVGKNQYTVFAKGTTSVVNSPLGTLDPTLMENGLYDILLTSTDTNGVSYGFPMVYRIAGDMKVGNFTVSFTDVNVPVTGIPVTVTRTYDSRDKKSHDFGVGWKVDIQSVKIEENATPGRDWAQNRHGGGFGTYYCIEPGDEHYVTITLPNGQTEEFDLSLTANPVKPGFPENCQLFVPILDPTRKYIPRPGTTSTLALSGSYQFYYDNGILLDIETMETFDPAGYTLTTVDGTVYDLDQNYGIKSIRDPNGNTVTYSTGGVVHSSGTAVAFTRDTKGRITKATDPNGGIVTYEYDTNGDLVSVTDPNGNKTTYVYNSSHGLTDIKDPLGRTPLKNIYDETGRLTAHIDAYGNRIEYTHDIAGRQEVIKDRNGNLTVFVYDDRGRVVQKTDPLGHVTAFAYDAVGNKLSETDPLGNTTSWTYDAKKNKLSETKTITDASTGSVQALTTIWTYDSLGKVLTTTDPMGHVVTNTYDTSGNLLTTTDAMGNVTTNTYEKYGRMLTTTDALGGITTYENDTRGNRTKQTDPMGNVTTYTYDKNNNKLTETDPRGGVTRYTYDAANKQTSVTDPLGNITRTEYDKMGNRTAAIDALGIRTTYVYNSAGKQIQTNYPDGTSTQVGYDREGNRTSTTDQLGNVTTFEYDGNKQLIKTTYPDGATQNSGYDDAGRQTTATDALGYTTTKVYDVLGRVSQTIDPAGNTTTFEYDLNGNQVGITDANGHKTTFVYDANNRQTQTILPGGQTTTIGYDALGRKTSETDAAGVVTQFGYDAKGNLVSVTDALGGITRYEYDANGSKTAIEDANGHRTMFVYDLANRMTSKTMPNGGVESYAYNAAGRQITKTDAKGQTIGYVYDKAGRILLRNYPDNTSVEFTYTFTGQRATAIDKRGITTYTYDTRNRMSQMKYPDGQEINYTYDLKGNIETISSLAGTVTYNYSSCCGRLESVTDPDGMITTFSYDPAGNRTKLFYPNGTSASYIYDVNNRLESLTHKNSVSQILASYVYTLGPIGNRMKVDENTGILRAYEYDSLYRLIKETVTDPPNAQARTDDYSYDAVGNRLNKTHGTISNDYTYNNADQLVIENGTTYEYDLNGNLSKKTEATGTSTYTYDFDNRLVKVVTPSSTVSYVFDVDGNRVETTTAAGTMKYLVDTNRGLAQVLAEYTSLESLLVSYVYADDLISMNRSGQTYYYHFDGLGSTRLLTDSTGVVTDTHSYDAFGNLIARTGSSTNEFLFTGQQYDANLGFYYLRARYYQPSNGRFTAYDPFTGDPYSPKSLHKYMYADADPVNEIDPSGELSLGSLMTTVGVIGILSLIPKPSYAGIMKRIVHCDAKLPPSPILDVALTCFAESTPGCSEGCKEKRAMTDSIYNRVNAPPAKGWCNKGHDVIKVLGCEDYGGQYLGYQNPKFTRAFHWFTFDQGDCKEFKDCIAAAEESAKHTTYIYNGFNRTPKPGRVKICAHWFRNKEK